MRHLALTLLIGSAVIATACTDPVLEQRVADLETKVGDIEKRVVAAEARPAVKAPPGAVSPEQEEAAAGLLRSANTMVTTMDYEGAKAKLKELTTKYPTTRAARSSARMSSELEVIGIDAGQIAVEKWYQGETTMDKGEATLVVFWEIWCPHCRREVPALQATWEKYGGQGLNMVAVTKITKSATEEKVVAFIDENSLTYPMAKEDGSLSTRFGVRGIPAAAVVKDGKVVWRGHPARLSEDMYKSWLDIPGEG
ncbi:MAG: redoxin domain-containing protein [Deltaproteobacteria bacterium]|nr:redoxin domain-containing protein [Deltaproteobacteria bacterium]MBW2254701.1 redoxin domain-containing protein [Deltaproteobacteria bacterium]